MGFLAHLLYHYVKRPKTAAKAILTRSKAIYMNEQRLGRRDLKKE